MATSATGWFSPIVLFYINNLANLLATWLTLDEALDRLSLGFALEPNNFDFIIVGAGSSGCVLANRLSEKYTVLLLEAGGTPDPTVSLPAYTYPLYRMQPINWRNFIEPQTHSSFGYKSNMSLWPSGKGLGGSSLVNGMIYIRGNNKGYDNLADKVGNPRFKMENVLKYFHELEDYHGHFDDGSHGKGGGMSIEKGYASPLIKNYLDAGVEMGYKVRDPNAQKMLTEGFAPMDFYMKSGRRGDSYHGFLEPIINRPSLTIRKYSFAKRLLVENQDHVVGVVYDRHGRESQAFATKEVILSAGSLASSKILMLSGIGPKEHLKDLGIGVNMDLPVGQILQDKVGVLLGPFSVDSGNSFSTIRDTTEFANSDWRLSGEGPLASSRVEATFSVSSSIAKAAGTANDPDIHTYCLANSVDDISTELFKNAFNFQDHVVNYLTKIPKGQDSFFQVVSLAKPIGTGVMRLRNNDPYSSPSLDPKYLHVKRDVDILVEGIKMAVDIVDNTESFKKIGGQYSRNIFPGCETWPYKSQAYFECVARHMTITTYKYCGTAPIGRDRSDPFAVVDGNLKVFGMKNLRVIDGSILRESEVSVNDVTCKMLGLLGSEIILDHWGNRKLINST